MWPVWAQTEVFGQPLRLTGYGAFVLLGVVLAIGLCVRSAARVGFPRFDAFAASLLAVAIGVLGAKGLFLLVSVDRLRTEGLAPFLLQGGLVWYGGLAAGAGAALLYLVGYRLDVAAFADCAAPAMALGHAVGRVGCFLAGCCWGRPTTLPWGVRFPQTPFFDGPVGVPLHPVQLYEAGAEVALAALTARLVGKVRKGGAFGVWLGAYGAIRLALELGFRGDDRGLGPFGLPPSVAVSAVAILAGTAIAAWPRRGLTTEKIVS